MALNLKTFTTRAVTAIIFVAVLLFGILYNYQSFCVLFFVVSVWGLYEFYQLAQKLGAKPYKAIGLITGAFIFIRAYITHSTFLNFSFNDNALTAIGFCLLFSVFIFALFDNKPNTIVNIAYTLMGILYAVIPFVIILEISTFSDLKDGYTLFNPQYLLGIILLIWLSDAGAYIIGSLIGKHKLFERISPGKTWEGTIGATVLTMASSYVIWLWFPVLGFKHWLAISFIVCVFGTIGDLIESMLKRQAGVKDSGKIMPGHGGILDRFDSLIFVSPFVYCYLQLFCK